MWLSILHPDIHSLLVRASLNTRRKHPRISTTHTCTTRSSCLFAFGRRDIRQITFHPFFLQHDRDILPFVEVFTISAPLLESVPIVVYAHSAERVLPCAHFFEDLFARPCLRSVTLSKCHGSLDFLSFGIALGARGYASDLTPSTDGFLGRFL